MLWVLAAFADNLCVPADYDRGDCAGSFSTVQAAVNSRSSGSHTVYIRPGHIHTGRVRIDTSATFEITGDWGAEVVLRHSTQPVVDFVSPGNRLSNVRVDQTDPGQRAVVVRGDAEIENVVVDGGGLTRTPEAVRIELGDVQIDGLHIEGWDCGTCNTSALLVRPDVDSIQVEQSVFRANTGRTTLLTNRPIALDSSVFEDNVLETTATTSGVLWITGSGANSRVTNSIFRNNSSLVQGSGIQARSGDEITIENNLFCGNTATHGSAVALHVITGHVDRNLFYGNTADNGAIYPGFNAGTSAFIERNTFVRNTGAVPGVDAGGNPTVELVANFAGFNSAAPYHNVDVSTANVAFDNGGASDVSDVDPVFRADACSWDAIRPPCDHPFINAHAGESVGAIPDGQCGEPDSDGDGLLDTFETALQTDILNPDSDGDGYLDGVECRQGPEPLVNSSFEDGMTHSGFAPIHESDFRGWSAMSGDEIEVWNDGHNGVPAHSGDYFVELEYTGSEHGLFQAGIDVERGAPYVLRFAHRGRSGTDSMRVRVDGMLNEVVSSDAGVWTEYEFELTNEPDRDVTRIRISPHPDSNGFGNLLDSLYFGPVNDTDGDGLDHCLDLDSDDDGLSDADEFVTGSHPRLADTDGDGFHDDVDVDPLSSDMDEDGLPDFYELTIGTDPDDPDSDGDGLPDGIECPQPIGPVVNGGFDVLATDPPANWGHFDPADIVGWSTTATFIEVLQPGGSPAFPTTTPATGLVGEVVANNTPSTLYQDLVTQPGELLTVQFWHHGRGSEPDTLEVVAHAPDGDPVVLHSFVADPADGWQFRELTYVVPAGQSSTRFGFRDVPNLDEGSAEGNFLEGVVVLGDIDADGDGVYNCRDADSDDDDWVDGSDPYPLIPDVDGDGFHVEEGDCDDGDPAISPDADEACDGIDNDCNTVVDDGDETLFTDGDGDGFGVGPSTLGCPGTGFALVDGDCEDGDGAIYPGAPEVCDLVDSNCDGVVDSDLTSPFWPDTDGDGFGANVPAEDACSAPPNHVGVSGDCDDGVSDTFPGAPELCDDADNDCNGAVDDGAPTSSWFLDGDGDSFGSGPAVASCGAPSAEHVLVAGDCDDGDDTVCPGCDEFCDMEDHDCDGDFYLGAVDPMPAYADEDQDTFGDPDTEVFVCVVPPGFVENDGDCDDTSDAAWTGRDEICDTLDNDCDDEVDEDAVDADDWYADGDGDGFGAGDPVAACEAPPNHVEVNTDCADTDPLSFPGAVESCDGADNDCDGMIDNDTEDVEWYLDLDGDGFGSGDPVLSCGPPTDDHVRLLDCDDNDPAINPLAEELCDGVDDNCSGDENDASDASTFFTDFDGDGFGEAPVLVCEIGPDLAVEGGDCDDSNPLVGPFAEEFCDGLDNDCDGTTDNGADQSTFYFDADGDGFGDEAQTTLACPGAAPTGFVSGIDCDDTNPDVSPAADEVCDEVDNDCDGLVDADDPEAVLTAWSPDADGDGFGDAGAEVVESCDPPDGHVADATDCDDADDEVHPAAMERCDEGGVDEDCDPSTTVGEFSLFYADTDGDGFGDPEVSESFCDIPDGFVDDDTDCDDGDADVNPNGVEVCSNGLDDDCIGGDAPCELDVTGCRCQSTEGGYGFVLWGLGIFAWRRRR